MRIGSLFSGIGGLELGLERAIPGARVVWQVEKDPYARRGLEKHWPEARRYEDVQEVGAHNLGVVDLICGGFPCQDISVAGRKEGITKQSRSGLFYELIRVIRLVRPKFIVLENVAAILNNGLDIVLGELSEAGYDAEWSIISASSLGAAHRRSRWWCVAYTNDYGSSSSSINEVNDQTDSGSQERQNQVSESSGSSESSDSRIVRSSEGNVTDSNSEGLQRKILSKMESGIWSAKHTRRLDPNWRSYVSKPILPRGSYGLSNRVDRTKALGNSIVPAVAAIPLQRVHDLYFK